MKLKQKKKRSMKSGLPPGTLVHIGEEITANIQIEVIRFNEVEFEQKSVKSFADCPDRGDSVNTYWINVIGLHEIEVVRQLESKYGMHPLVLEDIVNTVQRPKFEYYGDYMFIVMKNIKYEQLSVIQTEQISFILLPGIVISFQEGLQADVFHHVRERISSSRGRIRQSRADYLVYSLMDSVVDGYFTVMEGIEEVLEKIEDEVEFDPGRATLSRIHQMKRNLVNIRRAIWPLREVSLSMERDASVLFLDTTRIYLRDLYDHVMQLIDMNDLFRDISTSIFDIYLSGVSTRLNEVMKVLTVMGSIFIPLTFITSLYGMNFKFMPELEWRWGYFAVLGMMAVTGIAMIYFFKKKKWL